MDKDLIRMMEGTKKTNKTEKDPIVTMNAALYCSFVEIMENECFTKSILHLWDYNPQIINQLTKDDILNTINNYEDE